MPEGKLNKLGIKLKKCRKDRHMTQEMLSDASGVAVRTISKIERGLMNPSFEILSVLVSVLGMSFDSLFISNEPPVIEDEQDLIDLYRSCPQTGRHLILETVRTISRELNDICQKQETP